MDPRGIHEHPKARRGRGCVRRLLIRRGRIRWHIATQHRWAIPKAVRIPQGGGLSCDLLGKLFSF